MGKHIYSIGVIINHKNKKWKGLLHVKEREREGERWREVLVP